MAHEREQLGHGSLDGLAEIVAAEEALYLGSVLVQPLGDGGRQVVGVGGVVHPSGEDFAQLLELFQHGWDDKVDDCPDDSYGQYEGDDDGDGAYLDPHAVLHKLYDGVEEVGEEPCHDKGQEDSGQIVDQIEYREGDEDDPGPADELVEGDLVAHDGYFSGVDSSEMDFW